MLVKIKTYSLLGIEAVPVDVEVDISPGGLPKTTIVGLPEAAVRESAHRVNRAIANSGFRNPMHNIVINLAPADLPKNATSFDLPISIGILCASAQVNSNCLHQYACVGELALDGSARSMKGALPVALAAGKEKGLRGILVPTANAAEAAVVDNIEVIPIASLSEAIGFLNGTLKIDPHPQIDRDQFEKLAEYDIDLADVRGQETAKRALTVAASGGHNLLMIGPPGTGKTMLAKRFRTVLPQLSLAEALETTRVFSVLGKLQNNVPLCATRPFREPHHTISEAGLVGGGSNPSPGEISMAHNGVLFLDELPEFNRRTLEVLRQPLEDGNVTISRASHSATFPANFILIAALNPCPCGYRNDTRRTCRCNPMQVERYMAKMSGPLLDRIDIHIEVPSVEYTELSAQTPGTSSSEVRAQVLRSRHIQKERFKGLKILCNAQMSHRHIINFCSIDTSGHEILRTAMDEFGLSARAHDKILRIARTIADLEQAEQITPAHLFEAITYRTLDRKLWGN